MVRTKVARFLLGVSALSILMLSGCGGGGTKTATTKEAFVSLMEERGYTIEDETQMFELMKQDISSSTRATPENGTYQVDLLVGVKDNTLVQDNFNNAKQSFEEDKTEGAKLSSSSGTNYETCTLSGGGKYSYVCRVDDTLFYIEGAADTYEKELIEIEKALGYEK